MNIDYDERKHWVWNHEPLYRRWQQSSQNIRDFIRKNQAGIDKIIERETGKKPDVS